MSEQLPNSWAFAPLGQILLGTIGGGTPDKSHKRYFEGNIPWLTIKDMRTRRPADTIDHITQEAVDSSATNIIPPNTVIIATRVGLGKVVRVPYATAINQDLRALLTLPALDKGFLEYWILCNAGYIESIGRGTTVKGIRVEQVEQLQFPLAPLPEQRRIVAALESYLTRLDDSVTSLERVQRNLKRYRASVLKAAVEGRLVPTEAELARNEGRDYEPASVLLERILKERQRCWIEDASERGRAKAKEKAKKAGKPWTVEDNAKALEAGRSKAEGKYKEPAPPDTECLPELPEGWCWTTISHLIISGPQNGLYVPQSRYGSGTPILRIDDYQLDWSRNSTEFRQIDVLLHEAKKYMLVEGDIVVNRVNSPTHLGKSLTVCQRHLPAVFESNMMRFRVSQEVLPSYCQHYLSSVSGRRLLTTNAKWAVNQASINQTDVSGTPVPLPPKREQRRIVVEIDRLLSTSEGTLQIAKISAKRCSRLRQSILKWAFEGKLVDQDPIDEPASALLERIRADRGISDEGKKPRHRGR